MPTITLEGDANAAPHPEPSAYAKKFSGRYEHRTITGGIGHNLPQEAPHAQSFMTNPAGAAIVNAIGPIRQLVRGQDRAPRRYLAILPGTPDNHGTAVQVQKE